MTVLHGLAAIFGAVALRQIVSPAETERHWKEKWQGHMTGDQRNSRIRWTMMDTASERQSRKCEHAGKGQAMLYFDEDGFLIGNGCMGDDIKLPIGSDPADGSVIGLKIVNPNFPERAMRDASHPRRKGYDYLKGYR
jgi:hypothetical protein